MRESAGVCLVQDWLCPFSRHRAGGITGCLQGLRVLGDLKSDVSLWLECQVAPEEAGLTSALPLQRGRAQQAEKEP